MDGLANSLKCGCLRRCWLPLTGEAFCFREMFWSHCFGDSVAVFGHEVLIASLLHRKAEPHIGLNIVLRYTLAIIVHGADIVLRLGVSLISQRLPQFQGSLEILLLLCCLTVLKRPGEGRCLPFVSGTLASGEPTDKQGGRKA